MLPDTRNANDRFDRRASALTAAIGAALGSAPGLIFIVVLHLMSREVWVAVFVLPPGFVGGIWLMLLSRRYTRSGVTAVASVGLFVAGVAAVSSNDWWRAGPNRSWVGAIILGSIALFAVLLAGGVIPGRTAVPPSVPGGSAERPMPVAEVAGIAANAIAGAVVGAVAGFGVGFAAIAVAGMGDFGAAAIVLGAAVLGASIGAGIAIARASRSKVD